MGGLDGITNGDQGARGTQEECYPVKKLEDRYQRYMSQFHFTKPNLTLRTKKTMLLMESSSGELRISTLEVILFHTSVRLRSHYFS